MVKCVTAALLVTFFMCSDGTRREKRHCECVQSRGADNLTSISIPAWARFSVGQAMTAAPVAKFINKSFTRTINYLSPAAMRTQRVCQGEYPQNGGGGKPLIGEATQNQVVVGPNTNWNQQWSSS
jgi:hypothetical protein